MDALYEAGRLEPHHHSADRGPADMKLPGKTFPVGADGVRVRVHAAFKRL